ncbi:hypothetical protein [Labrys monachus]|uniref:Uncharacterized protein n=1 Tax=Labrys monachus TaxID=217067 RepID=A0ABU0F9K9_9HYPH|nr:hypothetical protein [Labrys monachus]MDQ0391294.1 hypothetical protein [Labrys monachus]
MSNQSLPQSLLALLDVNHAPIGHDVDQTSQQGSTDDLGLAHALGAAAGWADRFVYSPAATQPIAAIETDVASFASNLQDSIQPSLHHFFDDWINLLAPWTQAGAATFEASVLDKIHDIGFGTASDLHLPKNGHPQ